MVSIVYGIIFAGSQIRCFARAVNENGEPGREVGSPVVTIDTEGKCLPRSPGSVGADPFTAKLWYTGKHFFQYLL